MHGMQAAGKAAGKGKAAETHEDETPEEGRELHYRSVLLFCSCSWCSYWAWVCLELPGAEDLI